MTTTAYIVNGKWKMVTRVIALIYCLFTPFAVHAAFEDTGTGARPTVMGGTYAAMGDDVLSLFYNPASLARLRRHEISSEYSRLYTGLSDGSNLGQYFMGYGQPVPYGGTVAFGWKQFNLDELYSERTLSLGYGEWITDRVAAGFALKQLHHSFGAPAMSVDDNGNITNTSPSFFSQYGNASTAYSFDLGLLVRWTYRTTLGLSIQDVNEPNIALNPNDHEIVPRTLRMALAYKARRDLTLAGSMTTREGLSNQRDVTWTGAAEKWWKLRDKTQIGARGSLATGSRSFQQMATGAGYRFGSYQLDYAFVFNLSGVAIGDTMGTHRFSLSYRFGPEAPEKIRILAKDRKPAAKRRTSRPAAAPTAVAQQRAPASAPQETLTPPTIEEIGMEREVTETAQMMGKTPVVVPPTPVPVSRPIPVTVPAPLPQEDVSAVQAEDMEIAVQPTAEGAFVEPLSRTEFLTAVDEMTHEFARRVTRRVSAEDRLDAFAGIYPALKGYTLGTSDLMDTLEVTGPVEHSEKAYEAMKWRGASAQERIQHLTAALETTLIPALRNRTWTMSDPREARYKAWLEQAVAKGKRLDRAGVTAPARIIYWGQVAKKALEFERMTIEPSVEPTEVQTPEPPAPPVPPTPVPVDVPAPVVPKVQPAPVPVADTVTDLPKHAPQPAKLVPPAQEKPVKQPIKPVSKQAPVAPPPPVTLDALEQEAHPPLGDGEWLYKVRKGDTLLSLANRYFGDYNRWRDIYILNEDRLGRGGTLRPGQLLRMPKGAKKRG